MGRYYYEGPVLEFGRVISDKWIGETVATSVSKARSNLIFQFKKQTKKAANSKIALSGKIRLIS